MPKSKLTCRKKAAANGGGRRPPPKQSQPAGAASESASSSGSDESELRSNPTSKAAKSFAGASPRASSRATTPRASEVPSSRASSPPPSQVEIEKELRKWQKKQRDIADLMQRRVQTLNADQQAKLLRYEEVEREVARYQAAFAAVVVEPEGTVEDADGEQEGGDAAMMQYRAQGSEASSSASGAASRASSRLSLGSVVSAAAGGPSEFYEDPPPPTPPPAPPPLRRSAVEAGASADDAYSEQQQRVRQIQATFRRKMAQRRRAHEAAGQAAMDAFSLALERRSLRSRQVLMVEHVLQPRALGQPNGRLRTDFLENYHNSRRREPTRDGKRGKSKLPSTPEEELGALSGLQSLQTSSLSRRSRSKTHVQVCCICVICMYSVLEMAGNTICLREHLIS